MTYVEKYQKIEEVLRGAKEVELADFIKEHADRIINRKGVPTKKQRENMELKEIAFGILKELGRPATVTEVMQATDAFEGLNNQRVAGLFKKLVQEGRVVKDTETKKSKTLFYVK